MTLRASQLGAAVVVAVAAVGLGVSAQQVTFKASSDLVAVYATVRDGDGNLVRGLTKDDFEVRENGKVREIVSFSNDVQPITLAMIVDRSGSLTSRAADVTAAASGFFDALLPGDRVSLGSLTWDCVPLTDDLARLRASVQGPAMVDWGSPIWESIDRAFFAMEHEPGRRAILIFSDGANTDLPPVLPSMASRPCEPVRSATGASAREVAARAERNGVMVYAVGVEVFGRRQDGDLRTIAQNTGGELFRMKDNESLTPVFRRIAEELHSQYLIGFVPTVTDGTSARIEVRSTRRGVQVRARRSFAVMPSGAPPPAAPLVAPMTDEAVTAAIADGMAGRSSRATCVARGGTGAAGFFDVTLEGPTGRIMRAAKDARDARETLAVEDVSPRMRAATVRVTVEGRRPVSFEPDAPDVAPPVATGVRLRSLGPRPTLLEPTIRSSVRLRPGPFESEFDLAAVRALGDDIEVIVASHQQARCRLTARALTQLR